MRFPLILQMDFSATYCLIPGFVISFLIGHYQLRGRNRWGTIAVSLGLYLLFEPLWQVVERRWSDVWVLSWAPWLSAASWAFWPPGLGESSGAGNPTPTERPKNRDREPPRASHAGVLPCLSTGGQRSYPRSARKARRAFSRSRAASGSPQRITRALPPV